MSFVASNRAGGGAVSPRLLRVAGLVAVVWTAPAAAQIGGQDDFAITSVVPSSAHVGAEVRIKLDGPDPVTNYLNDPGPVVYFDRVRAQIEGVQKTTIIVTVPEGIDANPTIRVAAGPLDGSTDGFRVVPGIKRVEPATATPGSQVTIFPDVRLRKRADFRVWLFSQELEVADFGAGSVVVNLPDSIAGANPELTLEVGGLRSKPFFGLTVTPGRAPWWLPWAVGALLLFLVVPARVYFRALVRRRERRRQEQRATQSRRPRPATFEPEIAYDGPSIPEVPEGLARTVADRSCVLFAGGGISAAAGFPTWEYGLDLLLEKAQATLTSGPDDTESFPEWMLDSLRDTSAFEALDLLKARLGSDFVHSFVEQTYGRDVTRLPKLAATVSTLPFTGVITTNWDDVVTKCFRSRGRPRLASEWEQLTGVFRESEFFLIKLHGDAQKRDSLVLTPADYGRVLEQNAPFKRFIMSMFASRTFLFLGSSRASIEQFLSELIYEETERTHYALVPYERDFDRHREVFKAKYRVQLLGYQPTADHLEVIEFVGNLKKQVADLEQTLPEVREEETPWLQRVALENIGPFDKLELDLQPTWNVLLGDNGCGKSTILRAIALGLCGPDERVQPLAGSLLRHRQKRGSVALTISGETYTTELVRESGRVRVKPPQRYTPLESGEWLALGFPALRGISTKDPKETSTEIETRPPATGDLLPLLSGEVDTRMNDFKQWVYNAYIRDSSGGGEELKRIFGFLENVTPGLKLAFAGFDEASMKMMVETDDGEIPLELLSQGTTSVIAVVGTLLHRLGAVYEKRPERAPRPALVIVDEMAAHMHPTWQYSLAGLVQRSFEDLQIIAATHSPLLLGSIEEGIIFRLIRREGGIEVSPTERPLYGWLAEDIYEFMGVRDTRAEGFRVRLNTFKQLDEMRIKGSATEQQLKQLADLREELQRLPGEDPVSLTMELDNLAGLLDEDERPRAAADSEDVS